MKTLTAWITCPPIRLIAGILIILTAGLLWAVRPPSATLEPDAAWMRLYSTGSVQSFYLEIIKDGSVTTRTESKSSIVTRRGKISERLVKDFFQELENSEVFDSMETDKSRFLFYKGTMIRLSTYINGELRNVDVPFESFGDGFAHAFKQIRSQALKLKLLKKGLKGFITAEPLSESELKKFRKKSTRDIWTISLVKIETSDINEIKPLAKAIVRPYCLIPIDSKQMKKLNKFISKHKLKGFRDLFYMSASRGEFRCLILDSHR